MKIGKASRALFSLALFVATLSQRTPCVAANKPTDEPAPQQGATFAATPAISLPDQHDFAESQKLNDEAASQLKGLCSLQDFRALPEADRHVYAFDPWPGATDGLAGSSYCFNFRFGVAGAAGEKIAFSPTGGGPGGSHQLTRARDNNGYVLKGIGNLDWGGISTHVFRFENPVTAFGVVLRSNGDIDLRKFYWQAAVERNGFPVSYTLADGTVVQLGQRDLRGALIKADTDAFIGVIDRSGTGITSVSYTIKGLAGNKAQAISLAAMAFVSRPTPETAVTVNLKGCCDFTSPGSVAPAPAEAVTGLATLDEFRSIVGNHRYVYHFDTVPVNFGQSAESAAFPFDLRSTGTIDQKVTVTVKSGAKDVKLAIATMKDADELSHKVLSGLGDVGNKGWSEQTFHFDQPVSAFGVTYRSPADLFLAGDATAAAVAYTLSDGTVVPIGESGGKAGVVQSGNKTFVGVVDSSDKGIVSVRLRVQGASNAAQSVAIEDIAFAVAGPPPGDWKLVLNDNFDGDHLDPKNWSTGYKFVDVINHELQGFVPENVTVANGYCTIKTERRECHNTDRFGKQGAKQQFASGAFTSVDKFTQTYGYFEARIKMPKARGAGVWPAFWMLPDRGRDYPDKARYGYMNGYGRGMEIDIFEFMPRWKQTDGLFPIHTGCIWSYGPATAKDPAPHGYGSYALANDGWGPEELHFPKLDSEFHTYGLYWSPERLIWYVDSKPVFRVRDAQHVPDVPHFFLFNVSVHGNGWGKSPDKKNPTMDDIIADMPNETVIDYFRAYSGVLSEAVPASETDLPHPVTLPPPPASDEAAAPKPLGAPATTSPTSEPAAPANSHIATPSN